MKKLITFLFIALFAGIGFSQAPEKMSYQAVIRDASGNLVSSSMIGMRISILQGSASGSSVYVETHSAISNQNGLVSIEIGTGTVSTGDFSTIDWANGPYFIQTETDPTGGTSYTISGTSELLSVPYALMAKNTLNPAFAPTASDETNANTAYNQRNTWVTDTNITVIVPETGLYLVSYHGSLQNSSIYSTSPDYDGEGMIRIHNATTNLEINRTRAFTSQIDSDGTGFNRRYVPLFPSQTILANLSADDELELQYYVYGIGTPLTSNFYSNSGGITIIKVGN